MSPIASQPREDVKNPQGQIPAVVAAQGGPKENDGSDKPAEVANPVAKVAETPPEPHPATAKAETPESPVPTEDPQPNAQQAPAKRLALPSADVQKRLMAEIDEVYKLRPEAPRPPWPANCWRTVERTKPTGPSSSCSCAAPERSRVTRARPI